MNKEEAIEINNKWIEETKESIKDHEEVVVSLKRRVVMFEERIRKYELEEE